MSLIAKSIAIAAALSLIAATPASAQRRDDWHRDHHHDRGDDTAAGVALGIGLLGIAVAVAAKNKRKADERRDAYSYGYGDSYGSNIFSPAPDVNCYEGERRCYVRGQFSYEWTDRQFSYDPYRRGY